MADIELTQVEADTLIAMPKVKIDYNTWNYPGTGGSLIVALISQDRRENFPRGLYV